MHTYTDEYLSMIKKMWYKYLSSDLPLPNTMPGIRPEILESWKRSQKYGVKVDNHLNLDLSKREFEEVLANNADLVKVACPYLLDLYNFIKGTNFLIHLCDNHGRMLKCLSDDELILGLSVGISNLKEGSIRIEKLSGTDSSALCLAIQKPVQVLGEEHYLERNHAFFCSSAPIFDKHKELIAVLTMMGPRELYQHHTLGMVCAAVSSIEKGMRMQNAYRDLSLTNSILSSTIENLNSGIIILNSDKMIVQYNKKALSILKVNPTSEISNKSIFSIINKNSLPEQVKLLNTRLKNIGFTALTKNGQQIHVNLTISLVNSQSGLSEMIVLIIDEQKHLHQLVNKLNGFSAAYTLDSIIGKSSSIKKVKETAAIAAKSSSNVLILGESGTGKELLAQSIHNAGDHANGPFVAVNCGSIPKALVESELFGYEAGAFTGAKKEGNPGKFELADGGTLFLDEIGDMPLELQASLLRVLQTHEITRIGGKYSKKIDVKLIAATHIDLLEAVKQKNFRIDLYYRLNVLSIMIPPLRDRREDISLLVHYFIQVHSEYMHKNIKGISQEAINILLSYDWPGNIRELENIVERAINLAQEDMITLNELPIELLAEPEKEDSTRPDNRMRNNLINLIEQENGNVQKVAKMLDIPTSTLYRKLRKHSINSKDYRL